MIAKLFTNRAFTLSLFLLLLLAGLVYGLKYWGFGLTYQVTPSVPQGWYLLVPKKQYTKGEMLAFYPPKSARNFLTRHHWLPKSGMMIKYVLAVPGDKVCNRNDQLSLNDHVVTTIMPASGQGILLPKVEFCRTLESNEYLLGNTDVKKSFDARYFGPVNVSSIIARAIKL